MFVDLMTDIRRNVASLTFRAQIAQPQPQPQPPRRLILSGPTDTPETGPRALPGAQPAREEPRGDAIDAAFGGTRTIGRGPTQRMPADDVAALNTNRGEEAPPARPASAEPKVGRNDPCPCGSGKKYKKCHGA